jgi:hypothetical protein
LKVGKQSFDRGEHVGRFVTYEMAMVALISLVVVTQHALAGNHVSKTILVKVPASRYRMRKPPDDRFGKPARSDGATAILNQNRFGVGHFDNA